MISKYIIEGELGQGSMAVVYRARHRELGSLHAIKKLKIQDSDIRERLVLEGRLQSKLNHPNILSVTDLVTIDGCPALVMEYVNGTNLAHFLASHRPTRTQCDALARGILKGVAAAHTHGMVHRDLKPSNILIDVTNDALIPKIADFGLAKIIDSHLTTKALTSPGVTMGTPAYMAPEQIKNFKSVDTRADVFSLGAILYELMLGKSCFQAENIIEMWAKICDGNYEPPEKIAPDLPQRITNAINGALTVNPDERIPNVEALYTRWTNDSDGQFVHIAENQSLAFWPDDLRSLVASLAPHGSPTEINHEDLMSSERATVVDYLDDSTFADTASTIPDMFEPTEDSLSAGLHNLSHKKALENTIHEPTEHESIANPPQSQESIEAHNPLPPQTGQENTSKRGTFIAFLCLALVLLGLGLLPESGVSPFVFNKDAQSISTNHNTTNYLRPEGLKKDEHQPFTALRSAIFQGEYVQANRLIKPLHKAHPNDPLLHAYQAIIHVQWGRFPLAIQSFHEAASLSKEMDNDVGSIFKLVKRSIKRSKGKKKLIRQWNHLREKHSDHIVEVLFVISTRFLLNEQEHLQVIHNAQSQYPDWPILHILQLSALRSMGEKDRRLEQAKAAVAAFPSVQTLRIELADSLIKFDQLDEAKLNLNTALSHDPESIPAKVQLTHIYIIEEKEHLYNSEMIKALSDTIPVNEQTYFLENYGLRLLSKGRLRSGKLALDFCAKMAEEAADYQQALSCLDIGLQVGSWLTPANKWTHWTTKIRKILDNSVLDQDLKEYYTLKRIQKESISSARLGKLDEANALLAQVKVLPINELLAEGRSSLVLEAEFELFLQRKDTQKLPELINIYKQHEGASSNTCEQSYREAQVADILDNQPLLIEKLQYIYEEKCVRSWQQEVLKIASMVWLAEIFVKQNKPEEAKAILKEVKEHWKKPDWNTLQISKAMTIKATISTK